MESEITSDFWWLPENASINELLIGVGNHKEVADDEDIPPLTSWYHSINQEGKLSNDVEYYPIDFLEQWRNACKNTNTYRTLKIFNKNIKQTIFLGPFLVDIDNENDLYAAHSVTKQVLEYLTTRLKLALSDLCIFFTGHKGFNIEIHPEAIAIKGSIYEQIRLSSKKLDDIINALRELNKVKDFCKNIVDSQVEIIAHVHNDISLVDIQGTHIDRIYGNRFRYELKHPYIRLNDSINMWVGQDGKVVSRKKIGVTYQDLFEKPALEIANESEWQAKS